MAGGGGGVISTLAILVCKLIRFPQRAFVVVVEGIPQSSVFDSLKIGKPQQSPPLLLGSRVLQKRRFCLEAKLNEKKQPDSEKEKSLLESRELYSLLIC